MPPWLFLDVPINTFSREISNPSHSWWLLRATSLFVAGLLLCSICVCLGDAAKEGLLQNAVMELVALPKGAPLLNQRSLQKGRTLRVCFRVYLSQNTCTYFYIRLLV